jgi:hypothetical protein
MLLHVGAWSKPDRMASTRDSVPMQNEVNDKRFTYAVKTTLHHVTDQEQGRHDPVHGLSCQGYGRVRFTKWWPGSVARLGGQFPGAGQQQYTFLPHHICNFVVLCIADHIKQITVMASCTMRAGVSLACMLFAVYLVTCVVVKWRWPAAP